MPKKIYTPEEFGTQKFIELLRNNQISVYEDVQGAKIWVRWNGVSWEIRPKSPTSPPLNMVDMAIQKFYNKAYLYLLSLPDETTEFLDKDWQLGFEYFCDEQPANIKYKRTPKNNLVLTCIFKGDNIFSYDTLELRSYAALLDTDVVPVVYRGRMSEHQIQQVNRYLHTGFDDLEMLFDENNFAKFFYKLLAPNNSGSFLMNNDYQGNVEKFVIRFDNANEISFQLLNPLYKRTAGETDFEDVYSVILLNFLQFMQTVDLSTIELTEKTGDSMYLELTCKLYNQYMQQAYVDLLRFGFTVPIFFTKDKFKVNKDFIKNQITKDWMNKNQKYEYVLKIILTSLQKEKRKAFGIFTDRTVAVFNMLVHDIQNRIKKQLENNKNLGSYDNKALSFKEFTDLKDLTAADGKPYLDWTPDTGDLTSLNKKKPNVLKKK